jgi:hypothetical protein
MKIKRHLLAAYLVSGLLIMSQAANILADETTRTGQISEISSDFRGAMIDGSYYRLDRRTIVHAPIGNSNLSVDELASGIQIDFRTDESAGGSTVPRISEIWIYLD